MQNGQYDKADNIFRSIAKTNSYDISEEYEKGFAALRVLSEVENKSSFTKGMSLIRSESSLMLLAVFMIYINIFCSKILASLKSIKGIFSHKEFTKRFLLIAFPWFCVGMTSYGLAFSVRLVKFNIFVTNVLKSCVQFIVIILLIPVYERLKRY